MKYVKGKMKGYGEAFFETFSSCLVCHIDIEVRVELRLGFVGQRG